MSWKLLIIAPSLVGIFVGLSCNSSSAPPKQPAPQNAKPAAAAAENPTAGLDELDKADRELAEKQKICPVSDEPLGSMGKPYKVTVKGRTFFLCCKGCVEELNADPDKYLKKLK